jgi:hypothetical protein
MPDLANTSKTADPTEAEGTKEGVHTLRGSDELPIDPSRDDPIHPLPVPIIPMPIENLRILSETAGFLRSDPESEFQRARRDEWLLTALRHHPADEVARAAGISAEELAEMIAGLESPKSPAKSVRRLAFARRSGLVAPGRLRRVRP